MGAAMRQELNNSETLSIIRKSLQNILQDVLPGPKPGQRNGSFFVILFL
jgi:hypothetical protein